MAIVCRVGQIHIRKLEGMGTRKASIKETMVFPKAGFINAKITAVHICSLVLDSRNHSSKIIATSFSTSPLGNKIFVELDIVLADIGPCLLSESERHDRTSDLSHYLVDDRAVGQVDTTPSVTTSPLRLYRQQKRRAQQWSEQQK